MKYLIVNGDAFGASQGINRGILEAHRDGIPTSASLSVDRPGSAEAAELAHAPPSLGIGLHVDLDGHRRSEVREQLLRQLKRFVELLGQLHPGYVDADLVSGYATERELEVRTLCDPFLRNTIRDAGISLVSFRDVPGILMESSMPLA